MHRLICLAIVYYDVLSVYIKCAFDRILPNFAIKITKSLIFLSTGHVSERWNSGVLVDSKFVLDIVSGE